MAGTQSLIVKGLQPNTIYKVQVYAVKTVNGVVTHSPSTTTTITTSANSTGGNNFKVTNGGTDMQLAGGTIYAGTFDDGLGQLDPLTGSSDGVTPSALAASNYGVALNQFGIMAYNGGTPEFYIDSRTGNAYFAGTLSVGSITDAGGATQSSVDALNSSLSAYATTAGLATQNYTSINGGNINTGNIYAGSFSYTTGNIYSSSGMDINLSTGALISPAFSLWPPNSGPNTSTSTWAGYFNGAFSNSADGQNGIVIDNYTIDAFDGSAATGREIKFIENNIIVAGMGAIGTNDFMIFGTPVSTYAPSPTLEFSAGQTRLNSSRTGLTMGNLDNSTVLDWSTPSSMNGLRNISVQNGGSASGGNDGDIILIY